MAMSYQEDAKALRGPVFDEHLMFCHGRVPEKARVRGPIHV
jgi:hypothetical protein